jgi:8-oxo-dGTP pyrophosphatase MutT (NUDIX family)
MRIKYEVSAGGLLLRRRDSTYDALLIGRGAPPRVWTLPKGHVEARETTEQAGLREVREETGCWGEIITKLSEIAYWFYVGRAKHRKAVTFYLMRYLSGDPANHDHEVDDARWFDVAQARKTLKYVNEKRLVDLALDFLAVNPTAFGEPVRLEPMEAQGERVSS